MGQPWSIGMKANAQTHFTSVLKAEEVAVHATVSESLPQDGASAVTSPRTRLCLPLSLFNLLFPT